MKRIAVLTSGGDAPGMNAAIRAVVRTGISKGWEVFGIAQGYEGLINGRMNLLGARDVGGILQKGGTVLGSARSPEFRTEDGQIKAIRRLNECGVEGLIVIGGNGSQTGAYALSKLGFPVVGIASTIDNDLFGSEMTIGVDTALNIALEAIDRLKITASSHQRAFLLEVMGRGCGYLALMSAIAGGAEACVIPEVETDPEELAQKLQSAYRRGKAHAIIVVAEGATYNAAKLDQYFTTHKERLGFDLRVSILGHVQRGGNPSAFDRILASRLGAAATDFMAHGEVGVLTGLIKGEMKTTPLEVVANTKKTIDLNLFELARILD
jgi:6-phosphofructokinase 1